LQCYLRESGARELWWWWCWIPVPSVPCDNLGVGGGARAPPCLLPASVYVKEPLHQI